MSNRLFPGSFLLPIFLLLSIFSVAQVSVRSTDGYFVNIAVTPTAIIPYSGTCAYGYNYEVRMNYSISLTGSHIPPSLYTLQGFIGCNNSSSNYFDLPNGSGVGVVTSTSRQWTSASDCNTATVLSMGCRTASIVIEGPGINAQTISYPITYTVLSVNLVNFSAEKKSTVIYLDWQTAAESNNEYFAIERSPNGSDWTEIQKITAAGNSSSLLHYEYTDEHPLPTLNYYRLKLVDKNGEFHFSPVETVENTTVTGKIRIYPVPASGTLLKLDGIKDYVNTELSVLTIAGATLFRTQLHTSTINLPALKPGLYIIKIRNIASGQTENIRYVKL